MSIEAMKQALEALESCGEDEWYTEDDFGMSQTYDEKKVENAITSLRQAIAEAEKQEPVAWRNAAMRVGEDLCSVGPFGYYDMTAEQWLDWALSVVTVHAPPQPKREPPCKTGSQCTTKCMECTEPEPVIDKSAAIRIATSLGWTPKREWQGLTDEDCLEALKTIDPETKRLPLGFSMFAAAIQSKLKEKNNV